MTRPASADLFSPSCANCAERGTASGACAVCADLSHHSFIYAGAGLTKKKRLPLLVRTADGRVLAHPSLMKDQPIEELRKELGYA